MIGDISCYRACSLRFLRVALRGARVTPFCVALHLYSFFLGDSLPSYMKFSFRQMGLASAASSDGAGECCYSR